MFDNHQFISIIKLLITFHHEQIESSEKKEKFQLLHLDKKFINTSDFSPLYNSNNSM